MSVSSDDCNLEGLDMYYRIISIIIIKRVYMWVIFSSKYKVVDT